MATRGRIVKSHEDVTMTEFTFSGVNAVVSKFSVRVASDPTSTKQFSDMDAANTYYEGLISRRQRVASVIVKADPEVVALMFPLPETATLP